MLYEDKDQLKLFSDAIDHEIKHLQKVADPANRNLRRVSREERQQALEVLSLLYKSQSAISFLIDVDDERYKRQEQIDAHDRKYKDMPKEGGW